MRPDELMHVASYEVPVRKAAAVDNPAKPKSASAKPTTKPAAKTQAAASGAKHAAADPLAPLPTLKPAAKGRASGGSTDKPVTSATAKDSGSAQ